MITNAKHTVEDYFEGGCGRCALWQTPACKVHQWTIPLSALRKMVLECGLEEGLKWGMPVYMHKGKNLLMLAAFKEYCTLSFFNGSLLADQYSILDKPGDNSQATRMFKVTRNKSIEPHLQNLKAYIFEAMALEDSGVKVNFKSVEEMQKPEEFIARIDSSPELKQAFANLTPGRQKAYLLHFASAKQAATRNNRIDKCIPSILRGKGLNE